MTHTQVDRTPPPPSPPHRHRRTAGLLTATAVAVAMAAAPAVTAAAAPAAAKPATLTVRADSVLRPVTHVASGSLYGLAFDQVPAQSVVDAIKPNTFVQMAPGGSQLPNGEPKPGGDALVVAPEAAKAGAKVVIRMPDWYPDFPYRWVSKADWLHAVDTQVASVNASRATNLAAFEIWNEPDGNWDTAKAGPFNDAWAYTYKEIRAKGGTLPIQGPSYAVLNLATMKAFLQNAIATNTVPDVISWHELTTQGRIKSDIADYRALEKSLGLKKLPIDIEEYATPTEVGVPGSMVGYVAKFEREGVERAEMAFWNHYGTLGDTLTDTAGDPNGSYWLYRWYAQMSGSMLKTTPPAQTGLDGAASLSKNRKRLDVIFGGGSGSTQVKVTGLKALKGSKRVDVQLQYTPSKGRTTAVKGPITISKTVYTPADGSITVPVVENAANGYRIVVTPHSTATKAAKAATYRVTNANSALALAPSSATGGTGSALQQRKPTDAKQQRWDVTPAGSGLVRLRNARSGLVAGVQGASGENGAAVVLQKQTAARTQLWQLIPDGSGRDLVANVGSGKVLAVTGSSTENGAAVVQWTDGVPTSTCTATGERSAGKVGSGAVTLCGNGEYVDLPDGLLQGLKGDWSISAWVNPSSTPQWSRVFDIGTGTDRYAFLTVNDGTGPRFAITASGAGGEQTIRSTTKLATGAWSLVTVTVSGTTGTMYVNGKPVGTNTGVTVHPSDLGLTTNDWLGRSAYNDPYLPAAIDDVNVWSKALSASDVTALAGGGAGTGDVAHYAFDEQSGATATDSGGTAAAGTIVSEPVATSTADAAALRDHLWYLTKVRR